MKIERICPLVEISSREWLRVVHQLSDKGGRLWRVATNGHLLIAEKLLLPAADLPEMPSTKAREQIARWLTEPRIGARHMDRAAFAKFCGPAAWQRVCSSCKGLQVVQGRECQRCDGDGWTYPKSYREKRYGAIRASSSTAPVYFDKNYMAQILEITAPEDFELLIRKDNEALYLFGVSFIAMLMPCNTNHLEVTKHATHYGA